MQLRHRLEASVLFEPGYSRTLDERNGPTAGNKDIGVDDRMVIGGTGPAANEFANLGSGVSNWHRKLINGFLVTGGGRGDQTRGEVDAATPKLTLCYIRFSRGRLGTGVPTYRVSQLKASDADKSLSQSDSCSRSATTSFIFRSVSPTP